MMKRTSRVMIALGTAALLASGCASDESARLGAESNESMASSQSSTLGAGDRAGYEVSYRYDEYLAALREQGQIDAMAEVNTDAGLD